MRLFFIFYLFILCAAHAGLTADCKRSVRVTSVEPSKAFFDEVWKQSNFYKNPNSCYLQKFDFTGRYQIDSSIVEGSRDDEFYRDTVLRRIRLGFKALFFSDCIVHVEGGFVSSDGQLEYSTLTDCYLQKEIFSDVRFKIGKQQASFTMDGHVSSTKLLTIDRNNLSNNIWFPEEYMPGVSFKKSIDKYSYYIGVFSSGSQNKSFGDFDTGYFSLVTLSYDFSAFCCCEEGDGKINFDYLYNGLTEETDLFTRPFRQVCSLNFSFFKNPIGFCADGSFAEGYGSQTNVWGFVTQPYYNITEKLQVAARYTYLKSKDVNGIRFARYENQLISGRGDRYYEGYLGLNYYVYEQKLKFQTGVKYIVMKDSTHSGGSFNGWDWTTAFRAYW